MPLDILVTRDILTDTHTLSVVSVRMSPSDPWLDFGFALEDTDRGLDASSPLDVLKAQKVKSETAIPTGTYKMGWHTRPNGDVRLHVLDVLAYRWILIHPGTDVEDTQGCLLVALERDVEHGKVGRTRAACAWLEEQGRVHGLGTITITREGVSP